MGGKGNEGVASYVGRIDGAIGYVEYAYAKQNKLAVAKMVNRDGGIVAAQRRDVQGRSCRRRLDEGAGHVR